MTNSRILRVLAVALGLTLTFGTAAFAADQPAADGELIGDTLSNTDGNVNEPRAFGDVCPGATYGASGNPNVALGIFQTSLPITGSYKVGTSVTFGTQTQTGAQIPSSPLGPIAPVAQDPKDGSPSAAIVGTDNFAVPSGWNTSRAVGRTAGTVSGRITLVVGANATPNDATTDDGTDDAWNGTALWNAAGIKHTTNSLTGPTTPATDIRNEVITWRVLDGDAASCNRRPGITSAQLEDASCGQSSSLTVAVSDADLAITSADHEHLVVTVDWNDGSQPSSSDGTSTSRTFNHTFAHAGSHTAVVTVTDQHGATDTSSAIAVVRYDTSGILQPINGNGSSIFKSVSTIPVKVRFMDCDGSIPSDLAPTITVVKTAGSTPSAGTEEAALSTSAHTDGVMRFSDGQWIYNLSGKSLSDPSATYRLTITVPATGQTVVVGFALKA